MTDSLPRSGLATAIIILLLLGIASGLLATQQVVGTSYAPFVTDRGRPKECSPAFWGCITRRTSQVPVAGRPAPDIVGQMALRTKTQWWGVALDAPDGRALAHFYADPGWQVFGDDPGGQCRAVGERRLQPRFQTEKRYVRPVWPAQDGKPQMSMHLDIEVDDLPEQWPMQSLSAPNWRPSSRRRPFGSCSTLPVTRSASTWTTASAGRQEARTDRSSARASVTDVEAVPGAGARAPCCKPALRRDVLRLAFGGLDANRFESQAVQVVRRGSHVDDPDVTGQREAVGDELGR